jgi:hypothetical protein
MSDQDLRKLLADIQREIEETQPDEEAERQLLLKIQSEIRALLDRPESDRLEAEESFLEQVNDAVDRFQVTYPRLTMMLSQMSRILSNAGI